jgi:ferredoxin-NADP reductase
LRGRGMSAANPLHWQAATITRIVPRTPTVTSFFLRPSEPFGFRAGQHVDIRLVAPDGYEARRAYSIASAPEDGMDIELAIERLADGEVSPFFHEVAAVGDEIELRGPLGGHFVWSAADGGPLLLIGAGSGVAPLMSMIRHRARTGATAPALLLVSARTWDDVIFRDELLRLEAGEAGPILVLTLTREQPRRAGDFGRRIDAAMMADVLARLPEPARHTFICGSNAFVETAADALVAAGVPPLSIRTERYGI